jgi:DNA-binding FrmR family transcriptional regulator
MVERSIPASTGDDQRFVRRREVANRLKTVEGQLRAVRRMVMSGEDCLPIATQAAAALEGLRGAMKIVLRNYMDDCLDPEAVECNREEVYDQFIGVLERFIR